MVENSGATQEGEDKAMDTTMSPINTECWRIGKGRTKKVKRRIESR